MKRCVIMTVLFGATCTSVVPNNNVRRRELQQLDGCINPPSISPVQIVSEHSGLVLKANADDGSVVQSFASSISSDNWIFVSAGGGLFRLVNQGTNGTMSVVGGNMNDGAFIEATTGNYTDGRDLWCLVATVDDIFLLVNAKSRRVVDVTDFSRSDGTKMQQWYNSGSINQQWRFSPISGPDVWLLPVTTPVIAASAANLPDGRILMWASQSRTGFGLDPSLATWTAIYNPLTGAMTEELVTSTNHDFFCPGTTLLPNGVLMVSGGANSRATTFYDYRTNQWSVGPAMNRPRGYHAHTLLANGRVLTYGGSWSGGAVDKAAEVWTATTNSWRLLTGVPSWPAHTGDSGGQYRSDNHYWLFLAPNGKVFHAGPSKQMHWITTSSAGSIVASVPRGDDDDAMNGNAVMYDIGKILTLGGARNYDDGPASNRAYMIDVNGPEATVKRTGNMQFARALVNSVVLPNGEVVVVGGQTSVQLFSDNHHVLEAELWSPLSETFRTLPPMRVPRTYHSVAIIMKDGRVWVAGGGLCDCAANHLDFEILTPPYLYNADGSMAIRPTIQSAPKSTRAGADINVVMDTSGNHTFALIRASAVTHSVNNDQRRVPLTQVIQTDSNFRVRIPTNRNVSLLGHYFLFAMNANGVPSVGSTIRIIL